MQVPTDIREFLEGILRDAGYGEVGEEMVQDLSARLDSSLTATTLEHMPDRHLDEFNRLMDRGDSVAVNAFIQKAIPNTQKVFMEAMVEFRRSYLEAVRGL